MFAAHCPGPSSHRNATADGVEERSQRSRSPCRLACSVVRSRYVVTRVSWHGDGAGSNEVEREAAKKQSYCQHAGSGLPISAVSQQIRHSEV